MMHTDNKHWHALRKWIYWGIQRTKLEILLTSAIFPILEGVFVSLVTSASPGNGWPFLVPLLVLGLVHCALVLMLVIPDGSYPLQSAADAAEADEKVRLLQTELARKSHACKMLRTAIETLNLQTCQHNPTDDCAFCRGIHPVIEKIICDVRIALGVT